MTPTAPRVGGTGTVSLDPTVFAVEPSGPLLHEVVKAELAGRRQGTHATKTRGMVAGGRAKPWRQKGTGRARQGTTRAPQWRGGGAVFGPQPRDYSVKVNRKASRKARRMALSQHAAEGTLGVFDAGAFDRPSTKAGRALLAGWRADLPLVVVVDGEQEVDAILSFRNLPRTMLLEAEELETCTLLWARTLLVSERALERISVVLGERTAEEVPA